MTTKENHPFKSMFEPVESIETPDAHTAIIKLNQPHPALLLALSPALAPILPKHVLGDGQDVKSHPANSNPVGSGPFMLEEFTAGEAIVLKKNPNFFLEGRPKLDEIIIRIIKDPSALLIAMENGEADMYPFMAGSQEIRRLQDTDHLEITDQGYALVGPINWLAFNTASEKLSDVRVRQAIGYAVDREFITNALHRGVSSPQRGPIMEASSLFDDSIPVFDVDLDKAKALMDEAGFGDGMELTIDFIPGPKEQQQSIAEYMKSQLKKIGIDVTVRAAPDFPTWADRVGGHDFDVDHGHRVQLGRPGDRGAPHLPVLEHPRGRDLVEHAAILQREGGRASGRSGDRAGHGQAQGALCRVPENRGKRSAGLLDQCAALSHCL